MCSQHDGEPAIAHPSRAGGEALDAADVRRQLGLSSELAGWLETIERPVNTHCPDLPGDNDAADLLERLGAAECDRAATIAARPDPTKHPALWWVLDRLHHDMLATMGQPVPASGFAGWPPMPASTGPLGRHLYVWLYLAVLPAIRRYHAERGVPDDISWASLGVLGDQLRKDSELYGESGIGQQWALPLIYRGGFYTGLGRLAYDRQYAPADFAAAGGPTGAPPAQGDAVVNVHIPGNGLPLDPITCDESIARARDFFTRHFPERPAAFICHTWILDDQLADYLPQTSNIIRFQQRFRLIPDPTERADRAMVGLIFKRDPHDWKVLPDQFLAELPQDTTLQRAFVTHLRAGRHWFNRTGWFPLREDWGTYLPADTF